MLVIALILFGSFPHPESMASFKLRLLTRVHAITFGCPQFHVFLVQQWTKFGLHHLREVYQ